MKTWVKLENGKLACFTRFVTILNEVIKAIPTFNREINGVIGERKTRSRITKMKITEMVSVFLIPS